MSQPLKPSLPTGYKLALRVRLAGPLQSYKSYHGYTGYLNFSIKGLKPPNRINLEQFSAVLLAIPIFSLVFLLKEGRLSCMGR